MCTSPAIRDIARSPETVVSDGYAQWRRTDWKRLLVSRYIFCSFSSIEKAPRQPETSKSYEIVFEPRTSAYYLGNSHNPYCCWVLALSTFGAYLVPASFHRNNHPIFSRTLCRKRSFRSRVFLKNSHANPKLEGATAQDAVGPSNSASELAEIMLCV